MLVYSGATPNPETTFSGNLVPNTGGAYGFTGLNLATPKTISNVLPGSYGITENLATGYLFLGYSVGSADGACGTAVGALQRLSLLLIEAVSPAIDVTAGGATNVYLCNEPVAASILISKTPDTQTILIGETASFTISVTNNGNVALTNVFVTDALAPGCARTAAQFDALDPGSFDPGDVVSYSCTLTNVEASFVNSATGTGTPPGLPPVTATDTAVVTVGNIPPVVIITPTATPSPTAVPPTNTPTPVSTQAGERTPGPSSPTPVSTQAGERTPDPGSRTPVAPSTGDRLIGGTTSGWNLALILGGLLALTAGLSVVALGRRTRR